MNSNIKVTLKHTAAGLPLSLLVKNWLEKIMSNSCYQVPVIEHWLNGNLMTKRTMKKTVNGEDQRGCTQVSYFNSYSSLGHSHFISEICLTGDSRYCFSASWDGSVRLWNVASGKTISSLVGHSKDVLSVALSADDRQIITGGLDHQIKIWNTRSECKHTVDKN